MDAEILFYLRLDLSCRERNVNAIGDDCHDRHKLEDRKPAIELESDAT